MTTVTTSAKKCLINNTVRQNLHTDAVSYYIIITIWRLKNISIISSTLFNLFSGFGFESQPFLDCDNNIDNHFKSYPLSDINKNIRRKIFYVIKKKKLTYS